MPSILNVSRYRFLGGSLSVLPPLMIRYVDFSWPPFVESAVKTNRPPDHGLVNSHTSFQPTTFPLESTISSFDFNFPSVPLSLPCSFLPYPSSVVLTSSQSPA